MVLFCVFRIFGGFFGFPLSPKINFWFQILGPCQLIPKHFSSNISQLHSVEISLTFYLHIYCNFLFFIFIRVRILQEILVIQEKFLLNSWDRWKKLVNILSITIMMPKCLTMLLGVTRFCPISLTLMHFRKSLLGQRWESNHPNFFYANLFELHLTATTRLVKCISGEDQGKECRGCASILDELLYTVISARVCKHPDNKWCTPSLKINPGSTPKACCFVDCKMFPIVNCL